MTTMINGQEKPWPKEIEELWNLKVIGSPSKLFKPGDVVIMANYFTPRPAVDEYNRGSHEAGFTYTLQRKNTAGVPSVWQCAWREEYDPGKHDRYRRQA